MRWVVIGLTALCLASASRIAAQGPTLQGHPEDYPRADIEYGARLYSATMLQLPWRQRRRRRRR